LKNIKRKRKNTILTRLIKTFFEAEKAKNKKKKKRNKRSPE